MQAIRDALGTSNLSHENTDGVAHWEAQRWIETGGKDFQKVCTFAGIPPEMVRNWWMSIRKDPRALEAAASRMRDGKKFLGVVQAPMEEEDA
jgi:hypothetical protein